MGKIKAPKITGLLLISLMLSASTLLAAEATITVTKEQGGREIALKVGDILRIELTGRGGTGYLWSVEDTFAPYLKLLDQATQPYIEGRLGGPVMQVWRFKAEKPGATELKMACYRSWEGVGKAVDHFRLKIHIE